jgi:hypothetical protein
MLLANKAAQQLSTLRPSYITFKIKIGMVPPKSSFQITLLALPVVSSAQLASFVQETVMSAILSKVLSRLTDYKSSPLEFSKRWVSPKLGIPLFPRIFHLHIRNPSPLSVLDLHLSAAQLSLEEWGTIMSTYSKRIKSAEVLLARRSLKTELP